MCVVPFPERGYDSSGTVIQGPVPKLDSNARSVGTPVGGLWSDGDGATEDDVDDNGDGATGNDDDDDGDGATGCDNEDKCATGDEVDDNGDGRRPRR